MRAATCFFDFRRYVFNRDAGELHKASVVFIKRR
jgi:hypothetical protein